MPSPFPATLVTFAMPEEAAPFRRLVQDRRDVSIIITGMGQSNAETAIQRALAGQRPSLVITAGYAGALDPQLQIGEIVFAADEETGLMDILAKTGGHPARFYCSPTMLVTAAQKAEARSRTGAQAVEMESETIRQVCQAAGIPSATVRAISDLAGENFPLDFNRLTRADQSLDPLKFAIALIKSPGAVVGLLRLRRNTRCAARALADALRQCLAQAPE